MDYCKVTAIIRGEKVSAVEKHLIEAGACGMTVSQVKGCGEWMDFYQKDWMVTHACIEIFTAAEKAEFIAQTIMEEAYTGDAGDGIVAILPVQKIYRIRTRSPGVPSDL
jgi:nitrogen regulatory protein P-II 1